MTEAVAELGAWALAQGQELTALTVTRPSLEDTYLELIDEDPPERAMRDLRLLGAQVRDETRSFFRNPAAAGFTFIFPVMFLVIFGRSTAISSTTAHRAGAGHPVSRSLRSSCSRWWVPRSSRS